MGSYIHLRDREFYEDIYDRHTVEDARRDMVYYDKFFKEVKSNLDEGDTIDRPGNAVILNLFYMQTVGFELIQRYENREHYIDNWMATDQAKDDRIASAKLLEEPLCHHCNKQGLRIIDKSLMRRKDNAKHSDDEEVLFMLHCRHCDKNSAYWEDGSAWRVKPERCPKCRSEVSSKTTKNKKALIFTYTCSSCGHIYKDKIDLHKDVKKPDPNFDKDRAHFGLLDKEFRDHLFAIKKGFEDMARFGKEHKDKEDNKHIYDAINELKKPKIAELSNLLNEALRKASYIEFSLDKPEIGKDVVVGFNCLDDKSDRSDRDSEKTLKKTINSALNDTNWRLMSDGIRYRLGYLSGRIRAYEHEEDLKKLVERNTSLQKKAKQNKSVKTPNQTLETPDGKKIIL